MRKQVAELIIQARALVTALESLLSLLDSTPEAPPAPAPTSPAGKLSSEGQKFLATLEGIELQPYRDIAGIWTIGVGHVIRDGEDHLRSGITHDQAMALLAEDVKWAEDAVRSLNPPRPLRTHQFDALVCFCFNVGASGFTGSTLARKVRAGDYDAVPSELMRWVYYTDARTGTKKVSRGLQSRRRQTGELWSRGDYIVSWQ